MSIQRVPTTQAGRLMNYNIQQAYSRLVTLQDQLSSGKQLQRASDGPAQVMTAMGYRGELRRASQYERTTADAQGWLNTADSTMQTAVTYLQRARDLALQATNGSQDDNARAAAATELRSLRDGLLQLANTSYQGRPIFNGTVSGTTAPYDATMAYAGNAGAVERTIAPGVTIQVNATGPDVFGAAAGAPSYAGNAFEVISQLADDLDAGNVAAARNGIEAVDTTLDIRPLFHSAEIADGWNVVSYARPEVDAALEQARAATDLAVARDRLRLVQRLVHEDQPYTFLCEPRRLAAAAIDLEGVEVNQLAALGTLPRWSRQPRRD